MRNKTWLLMILILVLGVGFFIVFMVMNNFSSGSRVGDSNEDVIVETMNQPSPEQYRNLVVEILNEYGVNRDAEIAQSALLDLRVPRELQDFHIDLVFAFADSNNEEDIEIRLSELANEVDWLSN